MQVQTPADILNANRLIFPGVGAFAAAMDVLNKTGCVLNAVWNNFCALHWAHTHTESIGEWFLHFSYGNLKFWHIEETFCYFCFFPLNSCRMAEALCAYVEKDRPFLGICLGLQLLFESSEENGPGKCFMATYQVWISNWIILVVEVKPDANTSLSLRWPNYIWKCHEKESVGDRK